ncbi:hypothetical protein OG871_01860 [Kitasatospora sp. NBC_00374]|uniref:WXG100 family type VII secretion target n=1 Tax=Kitasatospora sp. NBC_00374 TaxID=2975964 RepID=UPI0032501570
MEFGNIHLHHETVAQAVQELQKAGSLMTGNLDTLVKQLSTVIDGGHFQGTAATAFEEFARVVSNNERQMDEDIAAAARTLNTMHEIMQQSDLDASKGFH